jgi:hypothetical protein
VCVAHLLAEAVRSLDDPEGLHDPEHESRAAAKWPEKMLSRPRSLTDFLSCS